MKSQAIPLESEKFIKHLTNHLSAEYISNLQFSETKISIEGGQKDLNRHFTKKDVAKLIKLHLK